MTLQNNMPVGSFAFQKEKGVRKLDAFNSGKLLHVCFVSYLQFVVSVAERRNLVVPVAAY